MGQYIEDVASGRQDVKLKVAGRPRRGGRECWVFMEEPDEPVLLHWSDKHKRQVPHFKSNCPHCETSEAPKPFYYLGALTMKGEPVIVELTQECFCSADAGARQLQPTDHKTDLYGDPIIESRFRGLMVEISRGDFDRSPRILRVKQRVKLTAEWPYQTRYELARIWGIQVKPRIWKAAGA